MITWNSQQYRGRWGELEDFYQFNNNKKMKGIFQLDWVNVKSALVYGVLAGIVSVIVYITTVGDIFAVQSHGLVNSFVFGTFATLTSLLKNLLTTDKGNFVGVVPVIPDKTN